MNSVATLPAAERRFLFTETAARAGFAPWVAEKDFWVCWILGLLFAVQPDQPRLLFKGGTSLSKVFGGIARFSEDIDVSLNREDLGFMDERDPEQLTGNPRRRMLEELEGAAGSYVEGKLRTMLEASILAVLGEPGPDSWRLSIGPNGADLMFEYPTAIEAGGNAYASQSILFEIGARSDHHPAGEHGSTRMHSINSQTTSRSQTPRSS